MIVEMDEIDIKDKLNNLRLVLKAKAKSKYGKGKRKQKVAVHTKTGKVVMATRTVGEGTPVIHGKATPQMLKQAQAKKDAIHNTLRVGGELNIKSLKKQLDISHPNLGITENEIKSHFIVHNETYESSGRGNNKKWRINKHFDLRPIATDHTNPNEPVKAVREKPKVEKEKSNFSHYKIRQKVLLKELGDPYDGNLDHVKILPDGTIYEANGGGVNVRVRGDKTLFKEVNQKNKWDWVKVKNDGSEVKLNKIPNIKLRMPTKKEVLKDKPIFRPQPINEQKEKPIKNSKTENIKNEIDLLKEQIRRNDSKFFSTFSMKDATEDNIKDLKAIKEDSNKLRNKIVKLENILKKVKEKPNKAKGKPKNEKKVVITGQDTKGWISALESFEKQGKSIPRSQFHALKNKFGVKDHKMHAPEWVHDKESDSYVHSPKIWNTTQILNANGKPSNVKVKKKKMKI
jgi:hypothetical protein